MNGHMRPFIRKATATGFCIIVGVLAGCYIAKQQPATLISPLGFPLLHTQTKEVIGFLPYWLLSSAKESYTPYITTLTYFGLTMGGDGHIVTKTSPSESEPGWHSLNAGRANNLLAAAKQDRLKLSLLVFAAKENDIYTSLSSPQRSAENLVQDIIPIMQQHGFSDLNLDIESISNASESARQQFISFVSSVNEQLKSKGPYTLTAEITASDSIKNKLIDVAKLASIVDRIVIMAYDYHYMGSIVSGPVSPLSGGESVYEFDVATAVREAKKYVPTQKLILGVPLYGYEWETITTATGSAVLPGSGLTASTARVENILKTCATCTTTFLPVGQEAYTFFPDPKRQTYHFIYYPTAQSTASKISLSETENLGGVAVWALGYEDSTVLEPLKKYK